MLTRIFLKSNRNSDDVDHVTEPIDELANLINEAGSDEFLVLTHEDGKRVSVKAGQITWFAEVETRTSQL
jgi:hypothetical protein